MLEIKDLCVEVENKIILKDFNLNIKKGEVHVIMGPNGSGKSTLTKVIAGHPSFKVKKGSIKYLKRDLLTYPPEKRAKEGIFISFQDPIEIESISNFEFLLEAYNIQKEKIQKKDFEKLLDEKMKVLNIKKLKDRGINEGFSGGEKKKNEILQMELFSPKLILLDEIDSGLDIDSLKMVYDKIKSIKNDQNAFLLITHYNHFLDHIDVDFIHILCKGRITKTAKAELAKMVKEKGYKDFR